MKYLWSEPLNLTAAVTKTLKSSWAYASQERQTVCCSCNSAQRQGLPKKAGFHYFILLDFICNQLHAKARLLFCIKFVISYWWLNNYLYEWSKSYKLKTPESHKLMNHIRAVWCHTATDILSNTYLNYQEMPSSCVYMSTGVCRLS